MTKEWCYSFDNSKFSNGTFKSLEAALKDAQTEAFAINAEKGNSDIKSIYVAECELATNERMFPDAEIIIEHMQCQAEDIGGEHASDYLDVSQEQENDLTSQLHDLLKNWCKKCGVNPSFYTVLESKEYDLITLKKKYQGKFLI